MPDTSKSLSAANRKITLGAGPAFPPPRPPRPPPPASSSGPPPSTAAPVGGTNRGRPCGVSGSVIVPRPDGRFGPVSPAPPRPPPPPPRPPPPPPRPPNPPPPTFRIGAELK